MLGAARDDKPEGCVVTESAVSPAHLSWALHLLRANIDTAGQEGKPGMQGEGALGAPQSSTRAFANGVD